MEAVDWKMVVFILKFYIYMPVFLHFRFHDQNCMCICCLPRMCHKLSTWFDHANITWNRGKIYEGSHWLVFHGFPKTLWVRMSRHLQFIFHQCCRVWLTDSIVQQTLNCLFYCPNNIAM